jgi:hypothetical protein
MDGVIDRVFVASKRGNHRTALGRKYRFDVSKRLSMDDVAEAQCEIKRIAAGRAGFDVPYRNE